ncbi:MAG: DUF721 domain-containing protein [Candidatus Omnitrophota bacterium]
MNSGKHIKTAVEKLLGNIEKKAESHGKTIREAWERIQNEEVKKHAKPVSFKRGILIVKVDSSPNLYKYTLEKKKIIEEMNGEGKKRIKEILFRIGSLEEQ